MEVINNFVDGSCEEKLSCLLLFRERQNTNKLKEWGDS